MKDYVKNQRKSRGMADRKQSRPALETQKGAQTRS